MNIQESHTSDTTQNVNENGKQSYFKRTEIAETPLDLIESDKGCFAAMGDHRVTEIMDTIEEVIEMVERKPWRMIINIIASVVEKITEVKNEKK